jgi:hypothetical protein
MSLWYGGQGATADAILGQDKHGLKNLFTMDVFMVWRAWRDG